MSSLLWTGVGSFLLYRAVSVGAGLTTTAALISVLIALVAGFIKGIKVLGPASDRSVARMVERGDGYCLGGFLSWKSWLLVVGMMALGKVLRALSLPPWFIAPLLGAVGTALLLGSLTFWKAFSRQLSSPGE